MSSATQERTGARLSAVDRLTVVDRPDEPPDPVAPPEEPPDPVVPPGEPPDPVRLSDEPPGRLGPMFVGLASWQAKPEARRRELRRQIEELADAIPAGVAAILRADLADVDDMLVGRGDSAHRRRAQSMREWFTGAKIEAVWHTLNQVERALVAYRSTKELSGALFGMIAEAQQFLPRSNRSLDQAVRWSRKAPRDVQEFRGGVRALLEATQKASDEFHDSARRLRNGMLGITSLTVAAIVTLLVLQGHVDGVWLVPRPAGFPDQPETLLGFVMLAGALGAFLTAVPTTVRARSGGLAYRLPIQQGLLKLAIGPLLAVVGVMFVSGGFVATTKVDGLPQLLALAVLFGSAQQAITAFADRSAGALLAAKDAK